MLFKAIIFVVGILYFLSGFDSDGEVNLGVAVFGFILMAVALVLMFFFQ